MGNSRIRQTVRPSRGSAFNPQQLDEIDEHIEHHSLMWFGSGLTDPDISLAATLILFGAYGLTKPAALNGPHFSRRRCAGAAAARRRRYNRTKPFEQTRVSKRQTERITVHWGQLRLQSMAFTLPAAVKSLSAMLTGTDPSVTVDVKIGGARVELTLKQSIIIKQGETVEVQLNGSYS